MIMQKIKHAFGHFGSRLATQPTVLVRAHPIGLVLILMLLGSSMAYAQVPGEAKRAPRLEDQWKERLNANTVTIIAGSPEDTYLDITHDLAVVLNDENLRILPMVGMGGAQNIRDVLYLKGVDIGITSSQMLRYFASTGELSTALDQRLNYITRLYPEEMHVVAGRNIKKLEDLNGKKVNFSDPGSSTQISARDVFGLLSVSVEEVNMSQADALAAVKKGEIAFPLRGRSRTSIFRRSLSRRSTRTLSTPASRSKPSQSIPSSSPIIGSRRAIDIVASRSSWRPCSRISPNCKSRHGTRNGRRSTSPRNCRAGSVFQRRRIGCNKPNSMSSGPNIRPELELRCPIIRRTSSGCSENSSNGRRARPKNTKRH